MNQIVEKPKKYSLVERAPAASFEEASVEVHFSSKVGGDVSARTARCMGQLTTH